MVEFEGQWRLARIPAAPDRWCEPEPPRRSPFATVFTKVEIKARNRTLHFLSFEWDSAPGR